MIPTDNEAHVSGIDGRLIVADGLDELAASFDALGSRGAVERDLCRDVALHVKHAGPFLSMHPVRPIEDCREQLIVMRDMFLKVNRFDWAVLCTHGIWWLTVIIDN